MQKKFNYLILVLSICFSVSCTQSIDLPFPTHQQKVVLNGLLNPDSTIKIHLSWSKPLGTERKFAPIENATVKIYENDKQIGIATHKTKGIYVLPYFPKPNFIYKVEAEVPDYGRVTAHDKVPEKAQVGKLSFKRIPSNSIECTIAIKDIPAQVNAYWVTDFMKTKGNYDYDIFTRSFFLVDTLTRIRGNFLIYSDGIYLDKFNATFDASSGRYAYRYYLRQDDEGFDGQIIPISFLNAPDISQLKGIDGVRASVTYWIDVIHASPEYDKYFKSSLIHHINTSFGIEANTPDPFAEPIKIYSNVNNGLGIFAAYHLNRIILE